MPNQSQFELVKKQLAAGEKMEYLCVANEPCNPHTNDRQGSKKVHLILTAAHAHGYAELYIKSENRLDETQAKEIQFLCALQSYRAQFNQCIAMASRHNIPVIFKPTAVGLGVFKNEPEVIAKAFYQAAKEFQLDLLCANVEVRFQVFRYPGISDQGFLGDRARQLVGYLHLNERNSGPANL